MTILTIHIMSRIQQQARIKALKHKTINIKIPRSRYFFRDAREEIARLEWHRGV